jgi:hypothetical protein
MNKISGKLVRHKGLLEKDEIRLCRVQQSFEGGSLEGASDPPDVKGEHNHYFDLAKALSALRAFPSCVGKSVEAACVFPKLFFLPGTASLRGESSTPIPLDQAKALESFSEE